MSEEYDTECVQCCGYQDCIAELEAIIYRNCDPMAASDEDAKVIYAIAAPENNDSKRTRYICCKNCNEGKPCYWRNNDE